jgi:hypothetical protein
MTYLATNQDRVLAVVSANPGLTTAEIVKLGVGYLSSDQIRDAIKNLRGAGRIKGTCQNICGVHKVWNVTPKVTISKRAAAIVAQGQQPVVQPQTPSVASQTTASVLTALLLPGPSAEFEAILVSMLEDCRSINQQQADLKSKLSKLTGVSL